MLAAADPIGSSEASRKQQVLAAIALVRDPEIDETIVSLDFVVDVSVTAGTGEAGMVEIALRLPTFWCPANFVFLMAHDIRTAVLELPWVRRFTLRLVDHFAEDELNRGFNEGLLFEAIFPTEAQGHIEVVRRRFDRKAFLMRQASLIELLRGKGFGDRFLLQLTIGALEAIAGNESGRLLDLWRTYLEKRRALGMDMGGGAAVILDGAGAAVVDLPAHLREIRKIATNAEASGEMCRMLVAARRHGACCGQAETRQIIPQHQRGNS